MEDFEEKEKVSVQELEDFFKKYAEVKNVYEDMSDRKTELYKELTLLEFKATEYLQALGKENYHSNYGTFSYRYEQSVKTPKTVEDKDAFALWLESRGILKDYMTFNSNSINSLYKKEIEATGDILLEIPGLEKGVPVLKTSFRRK